MKRTRREIEVALERAGAAMANVLFRPSELTDDVANQQRLSDIARNWDRAHGDWQQISHLTGTTDAPVEASELPPTRSQINDLMSEAGWQNSAIRQSDLERVERVVRAALASQVPGEAVEPFNKGWPDSLLASILAEVAAKAPHALELAAQLYGAAPCKACGFIQKHCRCATPTAQQPKATPSYCDTCERQVTGPCSSADCSTPDAVAQQSALVVAEGEALEQLLTRYWELAFEEGRTGESRGTEAQRTLHAIRYAKTAQAKQPDLEALHKAILALPRWGQGEFDREVRIREKGCFVIADDVVDLVAVSLKGGA